MSNRLGLPGLSSDAGAAFTESLQAAGLVGGVMMLVVAVAVYVLTPKGTTITDAEH